jgi:hypothetical protein
MTTPKLLNSKKNVRWWLGALMCACLTGCSADSIVHEATETVQVPMQFYQTAVSHAATRYDNSLKTDFLVSCYKGMAWAAPQVVMNNYQVKYSADGWTNQSRWEYVGTQTQGYYKDQIQRYWDVAAFPYEFYGVSPCPAPAVIESFTLTDTEFAMPTTVEYAYQTCNNGLVSEAVEPYYVAQVRCEDVSNANDKDVLNNASVIEKNASALSRYVAMPFHHLTSKVCFLLYNNYKKQLPETLYLNNMQIKVVSDDFVVAGRGYHAQLNNSTDMLHGSFKEVTTATSEAQKLLVQTDGSKQCDLKQAVDLVHAYNCECPNGLLQIPQQNVKLTMSFEIHGVEYKENFTNTTVGGGGSITYDKATKTVYYNNVPLLLGDGNNSSLITWAPNTINTYVIKINEFYPLTVDFSAELTPWADVEGSINTNLEQ